jgi:hypothetical protein
LHPNHKGTVEERVIRVAEAALAHHDYVSAIDVLTGIRLLEPTHVEAWRKGRLDFLEGAIQANPKKISLAMDTFHRWAEAKRLRPSKTAYVRPARTGTVDLRFSQSGDPAIEKSYRTHYISAALTERKQEKIKEKLSRPAQPVVFQNLRDSQCTECGAELESEGFLFMEAGKPLCLACAGMGDLEYLPSGETALTRRATKYSGRSAVVVRFSKSRGRYERQDVLVEGPALERAEQECVLDADQRAKARAAGAVRRREQDRDLIARMTQQMPILFPGCPPGEAAEIAKHTAERGSGRVGRTEAGRKLDEQALAAAVAAAVRHKHTKYDALLAAGVERDLARSRIAVEVQSILAAWRE